MMKSSAIVAGCIVAALSLSIVSCAKVDESDKSARKSRGIWIGGDHRTGMDHGHGHGWMKLHTDRHHDHSSKLSEAYVKFHGLGGKESNKNNAGIFSRLGNVLKGLGIGGGNPDEDDNDSAQSGWSSGGNNGGNSNRNDVGGGWGGQQQQQQQQQQMITMTIPAQASPAHGPPPPPVSGGDGWGPPPVIMQMQSGWQNPSMQAVIAQPTGWASSSGGNQGGSSGGKGGNSRPATGWATGDFASYRPPKGGNRNKGHFQLNVPAGKPAYIQKLTPLIDIPKVAMHGWRR